VNFVYWRCTDFVEKMLCICSDDLLCRDTLLRFSNCTFPLYDQFSIYPLRFSHINIVGKSRLPMKLMYLRVCRNLHWNACIGVHFCILLLKKVYFICAYLYLWFPSKCVLLTWFDVLVLYFCALFFDVYFINGSSYKINVFIARDIRQL